MNEWKSTENVCFPESVYYRSVNSNTWLEKQLSEND